MPKMITLQGYRKYFTDKDFLYSLGLGIVLVVASVILNNFAAHFADAHQSNAVTDLVLSNVSVINVDGFFVYGPFFFWLCITYLGLQKPGRIPFMMKASAMLILVRAGCICLTHVAAFPDHMVAEPGLASMLTYTGDLFFSGHTGFPVLMALVFWADRKLREPLILSAVFFALVVLISHEHYSIDVAGAFLITPTIYYIATQIFPEDKKLFDESMIHLLKKGSQKSKVKATTAK